MKNVIGVQVILLVVFLFIPFFSCALFSQDLTFYFTADMRSYAGAGINDNSNYFRGACEAIAGLGSGDFMIVNGDLDPPDGVDWTIQQYLGPNYVWYPVTGNHEAETIEDMAWLRNFNSGGNSLLNIVNTGPTGSLETTYSFDYYNCHFIILNQYFDGVSDTGTDGDVVDALYEWLVLDLQQTDKEHVFVMGHEPAYPQADEFNGRERHMEDSLNQHQVNRDRFWQLLSNSGVYAYFCGHTHNCSSYYRDGVWQIDAGHARGLGDTGAPSTFIKVIVSGSEITISVFRDIHDGVYDYDDITEDVALSVELSAFTVTMAGNLPCLSWTTQSETNNLGWNVYRDDSGLFMSALLLNLDLIPGSGNSSQPTDYVFFDTLDILLEQTYWYWLESLAYDGQTDLFGPISIQVSQDQNPPDPPSIPTEFGLLHNRPNPFNPETIILYRLEKDDNVEVNIYNAKGELVRLFSEGFKTSGLHNLVWDGNNSDNEPVESGMYLCCLKAGDLVDFMKMLLLK